MKRVLLDQGLAPQAAALLRTEGWDAVHVGEIGLAAATDIQILGSALASNRVCITLDHDFHGYLALMRLGRPSVVLLRIEGFAAEAQADLIRQVWKKAEKALTNGAVVSADANSIRIRALPLN